MSYDTVSTLLDLWVETNVVTNMVFSYMFLVSIFVITYVAMQRFDVKNVMVASTFITTLVALLMNVTGIMTNAGLTTCIIVFSATFFWMLFDK